MVPPPEFQAVILAAGTGSRFMDLTSQKAKCLLPIGNHPMIWYPMTMLNKIGFQGNINSIQNCAKIINFCFIKYQRSL